MKFAPTQVLKNWPLGPTLRLTVADDDPEAVTGEEHGEEGRDHEAENRPEGRVMNGLQERLRPLLRRRPGASVIGSHFSPNFGHIWRFSPIFGDFRQILAEM
jgi:hypothetical protein